MKDRFWQAERMVEGAPRGPQSEPREPEVKMPGVLVALTGNWLP